MHNLPPTEVSGICDQLGYDSPKSIKRIYGGNIHQAWKIEFEDNIFFVKRNEREKKFLKFEEYCLRSLQKISNDENLIIPKVISYLNIKGVELLLMLWIDMQNGDQKKLGKGLGEMHLKSSRNNPKMFGYPIEGYIGTTNQKKGWENNWADCFINLRIKPQLSILNDNLMTKTTKNQIIEQIKSVLDKHQPVCTLVHGDLWSGNVGISQNGKGVIFDPASWWADNEVDIAMTRLFGGFKKEFFEEYYKVVPKKKGAEERIIIYNFYHILNHANMFGGSYVHQVEDCVKTIINM